MSRNLAPLVFLAALVALSACGGGDEHASHDHASHDHASHDHDSHDHGAVAAPAHVHAAPRGGALVVLAEETAHVEILLDPATGGLMVYVLGAHAESPVRTRQEALVVALDIDGSEQVVTLHAQASPLTGETVGDSSAFRADVPALVGVTSVSGVIASIEARGSTYTQVRFTYP